MNEMIAVLKALGLPFAYHHFLAPPPLPYLVYYLDCEDVRDGNMLRQTEVILELYMQSIDALIEHHLEKLLCKYDFSKQRLYLQTEKMYLTRYAISYLRKENNNG